MRKLIISLLLLVTTTLSAENKEMVSFGKITVEGREEPFGIDDAAPRFGWQLRSSENGTMQISYRIVVATSEDRCKTEEADVWDSGFVESDSSQWVEYGGKPLLPNTKYFWRVAVVTTNGNAISKVNSWTTGMMEAGNWRGCWIGCDSITEDIILERHSRIAVRHLRKKFKTAKSVKRAILHICGLGYYSVEINGKRIGNSVLAPAPTQYDKALIYDSYDVTDMVGSGKGTIDVRLAPGYFFAPTQNYQTNVRSTYGYPKLLANLILYHEDNTQTVIATDKTWKLAMDGPIRYANIYDGTLVDFNKSPRHWRYADVVEAPCTVMRGNCLGGVTAHSVSHPVNIISINPTRHIVDFGANDAGRIMLEDVTIKKNDTIRIRYAESLAEGSKDIYTDNLRDAENTDRFVGNGKAIGITSEFIWHGFRYAEITGLSINDVKRMTRQNLSDEVSSEARITVDEPTGIINRIIDNARRGILSNYKGMPIDCPQRDERMPWLGDRTAGCYGESYLTANHTLYAKWLQDICDAQLDNGNISDVSPSYWRLYNGNITWPAALPFGMHMMWLQYGDQRPMHKHYDNVKRFLNLAKEKHFKNELVAYDRYGDWCVPPKTLYEVHTTDSSRITKGPLVSSSYYYRICRMMEMFALRLGMADDAVRYAKEADKMRLAINSTLLHDGNYTNGTVTANLLPLAFGIVPDSLRHTVEKNIMARQPDNIDCGVIGISWLMRFLSQNGYGEKAYRIATTTSYPGWGYMIANGATTIWELWNGNTANPSMNSANHVMMLGDFLPWTFECLAGIAPDEAAPGFKHVVMQPDFSISEINSVSASYPSIYGEIKSEWKREHNGLVWNIELPCNTTATIVLPDGSRQDVCSGKHTFTCIYKLRYTDDKATGNLTTLKIEGDPTQMNWLLDTDGSQYEWVDKKYQWGKVYADVESGKRLDVKVERHYHGNDIVETFSITNNSSLKTRVKNIGICTPFNDNYPDAMTCTGWRCNAHVWTGGTAAWVKAMRMGGKGPHLGLMVTEGAIDDYEIWERGQKKGMSNVRGVIALCPPDTTLAAGETMRISWRLFVHNGDDFERQILERGGTVVKSDKYVYDKGEKAEVHFVGKEGTDTVSRTMDSLGEARVGHGGTWATMLTVSSAEKLMSARAEFILSHQQMRDTADVRFGAFMIYDNEGDSLLTNGRGRSDLSEGRERVGMGIFLAEYARRLKTQGKTDKADSIIKRLVEYASFVRKRLQTADYTTKSSVAGKLKNRGYNYAWVSDFYFRMYMLTGDIQYACHGYGTLQALYRSFGHGFYCIDYPVYTGLEALQKAGMNKERETLLNDFRKTADIYVENGIRFPCFEVNYEQSIVAPAVQFLCEMHNVTRERRYLDCAKQLMPALEAFNGSQPHFRLNEIAIRHWDGYWFGKRQTYGDVFPHYWSAITAAAYQEYAKATGNNSYLRRAEGILRGNLANFAESGRATCAFVFPRRINGMSAHYADAYANDQDWSWVFFLGKSNL